MGVGSLWNPTPLLAEYYFVCRKPLNRNPQVGPHDLAVDDLSIKYLVVFF